MRLVSSYRDVLNNLQHVCCESQFSEYDDRKPLLRFLSLEHNKYRRSTNTFTRAMPTHLLTSSSKNVRLSYFLPCVIIVVEATG